MNETDELLKNTWLVVPAYNEGAVLLGVIGEARKSFSHVVVVDDCSKDDTFAMAMAAGAQVVRHPINLGQGAALQTGISFALSRGARALATFDADGQHRAEDVRKMVERLATSDLDLVIGSRFLGDSSTVPAGRRLLLRAAVLFTWLTSGVKLTDAHNGLRVLSAEAARRVHLRQNRMAHASEFVNILKRERFKFAEHPVTIVYTEHSIAKGQSWASSFAILRDLFMGAISR